MNQKEGVHKKGTVYQKVTNIYIIANTMGGKYQEEGVENGNNNTRKNLPDLGQRTGKQGW